MNRTMIIFCTLRVSECAALINGILFLMELINKIINLRLMSNEKHASFLINPLDLIMSTSTSPLPIRSSANYQVIIPLSICFSLISVLISFGILILILSTKTLHTVKHLLICNTCISSIFYCFVQGISYIYLVFLTSATSDLSCRCRAYFGYMSIAAVVYSYFLQALSRYFFSKFSLKYHRFLSFKNHYLMIGIQWLIVILIPLPALITKDIYYRPTFLCWVPITKLVHVLYTLIAYYLFPVTSIIIIYISIYYRVKSFGQTRVEAIRKIRDSRNLEVLRNIFFLILIYTCGGIPTLIYITARIEIFYSLGMIFLSLNMTIEKICIILLDREIRMWVRKFLSKKKTSILPMTHQQHKLVHAPMSQC